ncbi:MAG TPA: glycosyltransferase family 2 protein [Pirellulaceae bacterium]|jgi:glycosyltransferase involved in cell wall biosynthesis|nr:glycosyltransferase family 2 protein [Pirellulaceae bacterium]
MAMDLTVVIPVYNEEENVDRIIAALRPVLEKLPLAYEILFVDDGSRDRTPERLRKLAARDERIRVLFLRRNFGQTQAMHAGIQHATGDVIVTMDGDLQNDPTDIPMMLAKLEEGYDLVHGWRKNRQDKFLTRKLPSVTANWIISKTTGFPIHDLGCTLKAMRREIAQELELYGEMHRFIPILAHQRGARCIEVVANHHARKYGKSKYGLSRTLRVLLDLLTVKYMLTWFASPMKLFGMMGFGAWGVAFVAATIAGTMKVYAGVDVTGNPLFLTSVLALLAGLQFFSLGLLGEVNARIYLSQPHKSTYAVRSSVNFRKDREEDEASASPRIRRAA